MFMMMMMMNGDDGDDDDDDGDPYRVQARHVTSRTSSACWYDLTDYVNLNN